ncbi:Abi family protein [Lactiplantibacillus plantarum]|nr:Abi family protein [Lactiplantibacillus plantarum]
MNVMNQENTKPFKTHNQQLTILRNRGLSVPSSAKRSLEQFGYYSIINGYKTLFLQRDSHGRVIHPERFIPGATFSEIQNLYDFDKKLRSILYDYLLEYESHLGSEISYRFSEQYPEEHSYLAMDNYSRNSALVASVVGTISSLSNTIKTNSKKINDNAIKHYVNRHGQVPLWVLVNFLTFGDLNYFYKNSKNDLQIQIAKDFSKQFERSYRQNIAIDVKSIKTINHLVNYFRNAVAHGEITYSMSLDRSPNFQSVKRNLRIQSLQVNSQLGVFELIIALKLVLTKKSYSKLTKEIEHLLDEYSEKFQSVELAAILHDMNFPENYEDYI